MRFKKKSVAKKNRVAGQPAGEIRVLPAWVPPQEGGLTNSISRALHVLIPLVLNYVLFPLALQYVLLLLDQ